MKEQAISKILSANDTGETGAHQAGIVVPKKEEILSFFPPLNTSELNPRAHLQFKDAAGDTWVFAFIYYNNSKFGGTRNEYRLTRMTRFIREAGLKSGDEIRMYRDPNGMYSIFYKRSSESSQFISMRGEKTIKLGTDWKIINL